MMLINTTRKCSNCGCISFPDSRLCPKCGSSFHSKPISLPEERAQENDNAIIKYIKDDLLKIIEHKGEVHINISILKCPLVQ